jgi:hypothetical protein
MSIAIFKCFWHCSWQARRGRLQVIGAIGVRLERAAVQGVGAHRHPGPVGIARGVEADSVGLLRAVAQGETHPAMGVRATGQHRK